MKKLSTFLAFTWQEKQVLLYAVLLLNGLRLALWLLPFSAIKPQLEKLSSVWANRRYKEAVSVVHIVRAVQTAGRYTPGRAMCLVRALVTQQLLTRYGYVHQLHIGVNKNASNVFEAHAWIEYKGCVIVGQLNNLSQFRLLTSVSVKP